MSFARLAGIVFTLAAAGAQAATLTAVKADRANVRSEPATTGSVVATLRKGSQLEIVERRGEWIKVVVKATRAEGYIHEALVDAAAAPADGAAPDEPDDVAPDAAPEMTPDAAPAEEAAAVEAPAAPPAPASPEASAVTEAPAPEAPAAQADDASRVSLLAGGLFGPLANTFEETRTINMFAEDGRIESDYSAKGRPGLDLGLHYRFRSNLGLMATVVLASRKTEDTYTARLPHPLYLNKHRVAQGTLDDLSYSETAGHLSLAYTRRNGALGYTLFGGPSLYRVEVELIERATTTEQYPYDEVGVALPTVKLSKSAPGVHAGAGLLYALGRKLDLTLQARYGIASVTFAPSDDDETDVKAGGLQVGVGLRLAL